MYNGNESSTDEGMFLVEEHCFSDLLEGIATSCPCGMTRKAWMLESVVQVCKQTQESINIHAIVEGPCTSCTVQLSPMSQTEKNMV